MVRVLAIQRLHEWTQDQQRFSVSEVAAVLGKSTDYRKCVKLRAVKFTKIAQELHVEVYDQR